MCTHTIHALTHRPAGERQSSLVLLHRVHHAKLDGQVTLGIRDDGVGKVPSERAIALDVLDPSIVRIDWVTGQGNHLDIALFKLRDEFCNHAQFSGADWGIVSRVGEENTPPAGRQQQQLNKSYFCLSL